MHRGWRGLGRAELLAAAGDRRDGLPGVFRAPGRFRGDRQAQRGNLFRLPAPRLAADRRRLLPTRPRPTRAKTSRKAKNATKTTCPSNTHGPELRDYDRVVLDMLAPWEHVRSCRQVAHTWRSDLQLRRYHYTAVADRRGVARTRRLRRADFMGNLAAGLARGRTSGPARAPDGGPYRFPGHGPAPGVRSYRAATAPSPSEGRARLS